MRVRLFREWVAVALLAFGIVAALTGLKLTTRADNLAYDFFAAWRPPLPSRVTVIAIDEPSLKVLGRWPWPRALHARLLTRLAAVRPLAIGYDVLFIEPAARDVALADAIAANGDVVLPMTFRVPGNNGAPFEAELPAAPLAHAARLGHALLLPDADGILRRASLGAGDRARSWVAFPEAILRVARGGPSAAFLRSRGNVFPAAGFGVSPPLLIPTSRADHPTVSFASVLAGEVPADLLRGRVLLVGSTAAGSGDRQSVSSGGVPGVEVVADIVDALAADRIVTPVASLAIIAGAALPLGLLLAGLLRLSPRANLLLGAAMVALQLGGSAALLLAADIWVPPAAGIAGILLAHPLWGWRRLAATSAYMTAELARLRAEPDPLPKTTGEPMRSPGWLDDRIGRQRALLEGAVGRVRDLRRFFAESLLALPDATLIVDAAGDVLFANRAAGHLFGLPDDVHAPRGAAKLVAARFPAAPAIPRAEDGEVELTAADGRVFMLRQKPFTAEDGQTIGAILSFVDFTAVRLLTRQREEALRLLSHDMRAPQAAILALVQQSGDGAADSHRIAAYARRTIRLAEEFVLLTRAESAELARELLNVSALLVEAADELWPVARHRRMRVDTPDEIEEYLIAGDRSLLLRMFINLIDNAIRYGPEGTVIRCGVAREGSTFLCRIADQGPGIPRDGLDAIFRPFDRGGRRDREGTGLGLAFVRTVAMRHGGSVIAANAPTGGAVLTVCLPAAYDPPAARAPGSSPSRRMASDVT